MRSERTLVAGIGNIFLGDDGFGVEVARRLAAEPLGDAVEVRDFGVRGVHLAFEIATGRYDRVILVDAIARGGSPGTLYALEPEIDPELADASAADAHGMTPATVLVWTARVGGGRTPVVVVGCEPASLEESIGLSAVVTAAVDEAVRMVRDLIARGHSPRPGASEIASGGVREVKPLG